MIDCCTVVIDIEPNVDEKRASHMLEDCLASSTPAGLLCVFTVVGNGFIGLECTEHTCFDVLIVTKDMPHLGAIDFKNVLRAVGCPTPIIVLLDEDDRLEESEVTQLGFFCALRKPFNTQKLCTAMGQVMNRHIDEGFSSAASGAHEASVSAGVGVDGRGFYKQPKGAPSAAQQKRLACAIYPNVGPNPLKGRNGPAKTLLKSGIPHSKGVKNNKGATGGQTDSTELVTYPSKAPRRGAAIRAQMVMRQASDSDEYEYEEEEEEYAVEHSEGTCDVEMSGRRE